MNPRDRNVQTMLGVFEAVEHRDQKRMLELCTPAWSFTGRNHSLTGGRWVPWPAAARVGAKSGLLCSPQKRSGAWARGW